FTVTGVQTCALPICAMTKRLDQQQLEAEATAQIRKLQSAGISVSHCDTHKHTHILPAVLQALLHAAKNCGVRALRNPFALLPLRSEERRVGNNREYG